MKDDPILACFQESLFLKADKNHEHHVSNIKGVKEMLDSKADAHHSHKWTEIEGCREKFHEQNLQLVDQQAQLDDKSDVTNVRAIVTACMSHYGGATERHDVDHIVGLPDKLQKLENRIMNLEASKGPVSGK